ncbi:MAG: flippase [Candidatus Auribacter fodinae]|jgi:O-antigen/teichoic acid export membrane protein|uniref:Flippase n=1 Tax=Candidatus Auribacter fodinae TaxID=2093366 RepID=A0A3A4RAK5_9BACT|nr:MAG: flippase [Candidatus Auribacter fodinae]
MGLTTGEKHLLKKRLINDSLFMYISNVISLGSKFILTVLLARYIGPEEFGVLQLAITAVSFISLFLDLKTDDAVIKFVSEYITSGDRPRVKAIAVISYVSNAVLGVVCMVVIYFLAPVAAERVLHRGDSTDLILIYTFGTVVSYIGRTSAAIIQGTKRFKLITALSIPSSVLKCAMPCVLIPFGMKAIMWGYAIPMAVYAAASTAIVFWILRGTFAKRAGWNLIKEETRKGAYYVFHSSLSSTFKSFIVYIDVLILGFFRGPEEVAYYKFALAFTSVFGFISSPINAVIYPNLNSLWLKNDIDMFRKIIVKVMRYKMLIIVPAAIAASVLSPVIIRLTVKEEFMPSAFAILVVIWAVLLTNVFSWIKPVLIIWQKPHISTVGNFVIMAAMSALSFILVPAYGFKGSAVTYLLSYSFGIGLMLFYVYRYYRRFYS